jgi:hypothetical protein
VNPAALLAEALAQGYLVTRAPRAERLRVLSADGESLSAELRESLLANKAELLRFLTRREQAIEMVAASFDRLAGLFWVGCPVCGPQWSVAEAAIDAAYKRACETGSYEALEVALREYERFALCCFEASRQEGTRP